VNRLAYVGFNFGAQVRVKGLLRQVDAMGVAARLGQVPSEREMCPWAISKYFGDLVPNTNGLSITLCQMVDEV
jgi:hypothetical protein